VRNQFRLSAAFSVTASLLISAIAERAIAITYQASIISPIGYTSTEAIGISGTSIVGAGTPSSGDGGAFLLTGSSNSGYRTQSGRLVRAAERRFGR